MTEWEYREMKQILKEQREKVSNDPVAALELLTYFNLVDLCVPKGAQVKVEEPALAESSTYARVSLGALLCN